MEHAFRDSLRDHTLSASDALDEAVFPGREVVLVSPATTVGKRLASLGLGVECEPPLCTVTCSAVHGAEARLGGLRLCKITARAGRYQSFKLASDSFFFIINQLFA